MKKTIKILNKQGSMSQASLNVNINTDRLDKIQSELYKRIVTHVGILGDRNERATISRTSSGKAKITENETLATMTNATIGFIHEFGSYKDHIPARSFLRVPLMLFLHDAVREAQGKIREAFATGDVRKAYALLGIAAEKVIQEGFATGGYGAWEKLKQSTIDRKGSSAILIDSAQLRKSIHSKVVG